MARITVEDCLKKIESRFALVIAASKRTRQLVKGSSPLLPEIDNKPPVIALREVAEGLVSIENPEIFSKEKKSSS